MHSSTKRIGFVLALAALASLVALGGGSATAGDGPAVASAPKCVPAKNIEAIIDDSGSMAGSDPSKFRTALVDAFASINSNRGRIFGGVEFGTTSNNLFGPGTIPGINTAMKNSFLQVSANNGGTSYQAAWAGATAHNGTADARIFLTDGFPGDSPNPPAPYVKTYVIALGADFATNTAAQTLLTGIASLTGGPPPYFISQASAVQPVAADIAAAVSCSQAPLVFTETFVRQGQKVTYKYAPLGPSSDILISWDNPTVVFDPINFRLTGVVGGNNAGARVSATKKLNVKASAKETASATFVTVGVERLKKAKKALRKKAKKKGGTLKNVKMSFGVKAKTFPGGTPPTVVTTQVIR
jgi:hypothetical protein